MIYGKLSAVGDINTLNRPAMVAGPTVTQAASRQENSNQLSINNNETREQSSSKASFGPAFIVNNTSDT